MPPEVGGEGSEVFGLEIFDKSNINFGLSSQSAGFTAVVSSVANFLTHEPSIVMPIVGLLPRAFDPIHYHPSKQRPLAR